MGDTWWEGHTASLHVGDGALQLSKYGARLEPKAETYRDLTAVALVGIKVALWWERLDALRVVALHALFEDVTSVHTVEAAVACRRCVACLERQRRKRRGGGEQSGRGPGARHEQQRAEHEHMHAEVEHDGSALRLS